MELLTKELEQALPPIHSDAAVAQVKFFTPWTHWTWYAAEASAELADGSEVSLQDPRAQDRVDVIFFGPGDFSVLGGIPGQFDHASLRAAVDKIARAAKNTGKHWGLPAATPARARELVDMGARLVACGADIVMVKRGLDDLQRDLRKLGFSFQNQLEEPA